jgi:putative heme-binding domain-containing protein
VKTVIAFAFAVCLAAASASAQHVYTNADIENGARLYAATCTTCHGPRGDMVRGVALFGGTFRRATTDDEVARIIIGGIPGTAMPPNSYSESEAGMIVAYLRGAASRGGLTFTAGDAARGRAIFDGKGRCVTCHNATSRTAPSLVDVGAIRRPLEIEEALVDPSADLHPDFRFVRAVTKGGETVTGRLLNQNSFSVQILDAGEHLRSLDKSSLTAFTIKTTSEMPSYKSTLDPQELADVVTYLMTLRGKR